MNVETARNELPVTHDTFCRKADVKAVSSKGSGIAFVASESYMRLSGYFISPHLALGTICV